MFRPSTLLQSHLLVAIIKFTGNVIAGSKNFSITLNPLEDDKEALDAWHDDIEQEIKRLTKLYANFSYTIDFFTNACERRYTFYDFDGFSNYLQRCGYISAALREVVVETPRV